MLIAGSRRGGVCACIKARTEREEGAPEWTEVEKSNTAKEASNKAQLRQTGGLFGRVGNAARARTGRHLAITAARDARMHARADRTRIGVAACIVGP